MHQKQQILIIEQNKKLAELIASVLEAEGYSIAIKTTGTEAIRWFSVGRPDMVLMDLGLTDRSAFDVLTAIRAKDKELNAHVPVVGLTDVLTPRDAKIKALRCGVDDFLSMSFDDAELLARVQSQLRAGDLHKKAQFLTSHDPLTRCYNQRFLKDFLVQENERYKRHRMPFSLLSIKLSMVPVIADGILMHVGFRLQDFFRAIDCVARVGEHNFIVALPNCSAEEARGVAHRFSGFLGEGVFSEELEFCVNVASVPDQASDHHELLRVMGDGGQAPKQVENLG